MKFDKLNATIPYAIGGKLKSLTMEPYDNIRLVMPGRHADQTLPKGGDFAVCVTEPVLGWTDHQFTHTDLFIDLEEKTRTEFDSATVLTGLYYEVIIGTDPDKMIVPGGDRFPGIDYKTFLHAVQCLGVAEHRRYAQHEAAFGGRYLPFRFAAGIVEQLWTATHAAEKQRYGRQGVQQLERNYGTPSLTRKLMS